MQIAEAAEASGLEVAFEKIKRTPNTIDAHRLIRWSKPEGCQTPLVNSLFRRYFAQGEDISEHGVLVDAAREVGMDGDVISRLLKTGNDTDDIRAVVDITDSGQVFNALSSYAGFDELLPGTGVPKFDAVVHFAALARILIKPDNETFRVNAIGTYNVIEAATKLGIGKVVVASSETTYGVCFADGEVSPDYLPVTEEHDTNPHDSYGLSKVVNEKTARSFQTRTGADIYCPRIGGNLFQRGLG